MLIPDKSNYALRFIEDGDYRYTMQVIDDNDYVCCSIRIPVNIYDEILMYISEESVYRLTKDYTVVTIDIPLNSTRFRYSIILLNNQQCMIIKQMDLITHRLISEYYINYENI